jgi:hypothetical protein
MKVAFKCSSAFKLLCAKITVNSRIRAPYYCGVVLAVISWAPIRATNSASNVIVYLKTLDYWWIIAHYLPRYTKEKLSYSLKSCITP